MKNRFTLLATILLTSVLMTGFALTKVISADISKSQLNSSPVGNVTPSTGAFTTLTASGKFTENSGVINSGTGIKHVRTASCTTTSGTTGFCGGSVTWPGTAFADTNYTAMCDVDGTATISLQGTTAKTTTTISYVVYNVNANTTATSGVLNCFAFHD